MATRRQNESKFPHWIDLADQGRLYGRDARSRSGKIVRSIKIVDAAFLAQLGYQAQVKAIALAA